MDTINRRDLLKLISAAPVAASFALTDAEAQEAHHQARQATWRRRPASMPRRSSSPREYQTVRVLSDLIIPADERSGSATTAGVPEFMDFTMIDQPARQVAMRGGNWRGSTPNALRRFDKTFVGAGGRAYRSAGCNLRLRPDRPAPRARTGVLPRFRDLTATGFWTTKVGMADLGYTGNTVVPKWEGCLRTAEEARAAAVSPGLSDHASPHPRAAAASAVTPHR